MPPQPLVKRGQERLDAFQRLDDVKCFARRAPAADRDGRAR